MKSKSEKYIIDLVASQDKKHREKGCRMLHDYLFPEALGVLRKVIPFGAHDEIWQSAILEFIDQIRYGKYEYRPEAKVFTYFYPILVRTGYRFIKENEKLKDAEALKAWAKSQETSTSVLWDIEKEKTELEKLQECIEKLTEENREIVSAFYYHNERLNQIHKEFGLKESTIRERLSSIRKQLYNCIKRTSS